MAQSDAAASGYPQNVSLTSKRSRTRAIRRLKALTVKEFYQIIRDPSTILISFFLPLLLLFLYGFGVSLDLDHLRIALVMEDSSPDAMSLAKSFTNSRFFDVKIGRDRREFTHDILSGKVRGIVVIPSYFSEFRFKPDVKAPIQVIADGSEPNTANFVHNYVSSAWMNWLRQESISNDLQGLPLIQVDSRIWFNEQLESRNFLVPGSLAIIMSLIGTLLTSLVVAKEWERGTMESLMATPVTIVELLAGKLIPYFLLGMGSMFLSVLAAKILYDIPFRGSILMLEVTAACFLTTALGTGLLISTLARNQFVAAQAAMVAAFLPAYILSGFIFEIASMPPVIRAITTLIPARYFVTSLQTLFLVGNVWELLIRDALYMLLFSLVLYTIIAQFTVKRLD